MHAGKFLATIALLCLCLCARAQFRVDTEVRNFVQEDLRKEAPFYDLGAYTRLVPSTMHMGLGFVGVPTRHALLDRTIEETIAHVFGLSTGFLLKYTVTRNRPDGSDNQSFPSGHTLFAFTGAELTRMDYGWGWGGGAYAVAVFTGAERLWGDKHWVTDVLAGAGIGILAAHVGGWLLEPVKNLFGIPTIEWDGFRKTQVAFAPCIDPFSGSYSATFSLTF
ncbi:MAG: phosphatase PAP2 family protein [Bacteroidales bacterium]|nr:phosphatase PAP2 family protein [Bacteroidales bacterium]